MTSMVDRATLVSLLQWRAAHQGRKLAYTFIQRAASETSWDYETLDRKARAIAAVLQAEGSAGERALIVVPQSLEYIAGFFGCLYAEAIAVSTYPPVSKGHLHRIQAIARDSQAKFMVTTRKILDMILAEATLAPLLVGLIPVVIDDLDDGQASRWSSPTITGAATAFLQYTSGSTSAPKGVVVTHDNIVYNEKMIETAFGHDESSVLVGWLPFFHDMGLIGQILQPLWVGFPAVLMSPITFIQKPVSWLAAISQFRATTSGAPNFAYQMCLDAVTAEDKASLDLSSWRVAFNGAEPIRAETLRRFSEGFEGCGFRRETFFPCYGLAEVTLLATGGRPDAVPVIYRVDAAELDQGRVVASAGTPETMATPATETGGRELVGCGHTQLGQQIRIVEPASLRECSAGQVGEIWIAGRNVAAGYWNQPEETRATFQAHLPGTDDGPYLRTGDLGFLRSDGELFVVDRLKDVVIVRGRNHASHDLELTVERSHPDLRALCVAAFSIDTDAHGGERVVVVAEVRRESLATFDPVAAEKLVRRSVAVHHDLELFAVSFVSPASVPKTTSGKMQRQACKKHYLAGTLPSFATAISL